MLSIEPFRVFMNSISVALELISPRIPTTMSQEECRLQPYVLVRRTYRKPGTNLAPGSPRDETRLNFYFHVRSWCFSHNRERYVKSNITQGQKNLSPFVEH